MDKKIFNKKRNSSFELLRIICMIFIIMNHYSYYGGWSDFTISTFRWQVPFIQTMHIGGTIAVDVFMLITGYFNYRKEIDWKKYILLVLEMYFYSVIIYTILLSFGLIEFSGKAFIKAVILPIVYGNWYMVYYLLFYLFIPYMNKLIFMLDRKENKTLILIWLIVCSFIPTFIHGWSFGNLMIFFGLYLLGAYINKFGINEKQVYIIGGISLFGLLISPTVLDFISVYMKSEKFLTRTSFFDTRTSILVVLSALLLFLLFKNMNIYKKSINIIASATPGIYLIHDNEHMREILWQKWWPNIDFFALSNIWAQAITKTIVIFIVCCIIELARKYTLEQLIRHFLDRNWPVITKRIIILKKACSKCLFFTRKTIQ